MWFCMFYLGFYVRFDPPEKGAPISSAGYAALVMVYLFAAAFQVSLPETCTSPTRPMVVVSETMSWLRPEVRSARYRARVLTTN